MKPEVHIASNEEELVGQVRKYLEQKLSVILEMNGIVAIGVSGGSMPRIITKAILSQKDLNWKRIRIFMVDERHVDVNSEDSNQGEYLRLFPSELSEVIIPVPIHEDIRVSARAYEFNLRKYLLPDQFNTIPRFDFVFLGVGPDGHTASLFPGRGSPDKVTDMNWVSVVTDSPKPPAARITLTYDTINYAKNVAFIITGQAKAEIVNGILMRNTKYPAGAIRPINNKLVLFLDEAAAAGVSESMSSPEPESPPPFDG